jgi:hypothetical protein
VEPAPFEAPAVETPAPLADETTPTPDATAEDAAPAADTAEKPTEEPPAADADQAADAAVPPAEPQEPATEKADQSEPAEPAADPFSTTEPARRWIDATGRYAVVGTLLAVHEATAEIRTADGRTVTVPLDRLSPHDRAYAEQAGPRLLAGPAAPRPSDTAGL